MLGNQFMGMPIAITVEGEKRLRHITLPLYHALITFVLPMLLFELL